MTHFFISDKFIHKEDDSRLQSSDHWIVPIWNLGGQDLPRVFLGDHGFLSKYGSRLKGPEVAKRMHYALSLASMGLAAGDERCLRATQDAARKAAQKPCVLYHTDVMLKTEGKGLHFGRCMASLLQAVRAWAPEFIEYDPIVGCFLQSFATYQPYSQRETSNLGIADREWEKETERIRSFHPAVVTVGGDYLDFVLASGRFDIAQSALMLYSHLCHQLSIPLIMTSYTGYFSIGSEQASFLADLLDAVMVPINPKGFGMLPDSTTLLSWAHLFGKPVIAMHPIGSGLVDVRQGLAYVFGEAGAAAAIVGASTDEHIDEFVRSGRDVLQEEIS